MQCEFRKYQGLIHTTNVFYSNLFFEVVATSVYFDITIYNTSNKDYGTELASEIHGKHTNFDSRL